MHNNIAIGYQAAYRLSTGNYNIAIGDNTLAASGVSGGHNIIMGYSTGTSITSGDYNIAIGRESLVHTSTADHNLAIGYRRFTIYRSKNIHNNRYYRYWS